MSRRKRERRWAHRMAFDGPRDWRRRFGAYLPAVMMTGLVPAFFIGLLSGQSRLVVGTILGMGLALLAARRIRDSSHRYALGRQAVGSATILLALAIGLSAHMAGGAPIPIALLLAAAGGFGAHLLYGDLVPEPEVELEPVPEAVPDPIDLPQPAEEPPIVIEGRRKLLRVRHTAISLSDPNLTRAADALGAVLDELARNPSEVPQARRFLVVQLEGLTRIAERLDNGATPPATLYGLLDEMAGAANALRIQLRAHETEALAIQVKVLQERLRQEGYGPGTAPGQSAS